jgi:hypothetical protein
MSTVSLLSGACLCGEVRIEILERPDRAPEACHCTYCRKQSGHVLAAVNVKRDMLRVHGNDKVTWYKSSEKVQRGFCSICGSTLFWKPTIDGYQYTAVAMGALEGPTGMKLSKHTFVGDKGDYYEIADGVAQSDSY